jgi:pimeloyl-ACP methyl ester carboxylesterase
MVFEGATANFNPRSAMKVDFTRKGRAPLLFIAGGKDQIMPAKLNRWNFEHYKSGLVAFHEFPERDHFTCGAPGWQKVADFAIDWAMEPSATARAA